MNKQTLFIGGTHGDEPIGVRALKNLSAKRQDFDWTIGNPLALEAGTREYGGNLNRSAPGNIASEKYSVRRAAELIEQSNNYDYTIDIHGTTKDTGIFVIICNPKAANFALAKQLNIKRVVYWPAVSPELDGPLCEFFPCGLEIECGDKNNPETQVELEQILTDFLDNQTIQDEPQEIYEVYDVMFDPVEIQPQEFVEVTINNETFFPLLIGSYQRDGVACYKMRRTNPDNLTKPQEN